MATIQSVLEQAMKLAPEERATLAEALQQSVVEPFEDASTQTAWLEELERRTADRRAGRTQARPWREVEDELRGELDDPAA